MDGDGCFLEIAMSFIHLDCLTKLIHSPVVWIGLSGGLDSIVLLEQLAAIPEIFQKLKVIHVNHGLIPNASHWENFCI